MATKNKRPIYISVIAKEDGEGTHTAFYFGKATVAQLSMINHEIDLLKMEILDRINGSPKEYEVLEDNGE